MADDGPDTGGAPGLDSRFEKLYILSVDPCPCPLSAGVGADGEDDRRRRLLVGDDWRGVGWELFLDRSSEIVVC